MDGIDLADPELWATGNGVIQDIATPLERGNFISFYQASTFSPQTLKTVTTWVLCH
jgi:hypothetical protein